MTLLDAVFDAIARRAAAFLQFYNCPKLLYFMIKFFCKALDVLYFVLRDFMALLERILQAFKLKQFSQRFLEIGKTFGMKWVNIKRKKSTMSGKHLKLTHSAVLMAGLTMASKSKFMINI